MEKLLDFTIVFTGKCNLSCKYCPLTHKGEEISYETLDAYIEFFYLHQDFLSRNTETLELLLFGGEPCLVFEKIRYFIDRMLDLPLKTVFKIYTNATKITPEIFSYIVSIPDYKNRITLFLSIDGDVNRMLKNRLKDSKQFDKIMENIALIKDYSIPFTISKVISEQTAEDFLDSLLFIHSLNPRGICLYPSSFKSYENLDKNSMTELIRGLDKFIHHLDSLGYSKRGIMNYLNMDYYMNTSLTDQIDVGIIGDIDGVIYGILEAISIFHTSSTFSATQLQKVTLGNIQNNHTEILNSISQYSNVKEQISLTGLEWYQAQYPNELNMFLMLHKYCSLRFAT